VIAGDWNVPDSGVGYVTRFEIDRAFASCYPGSSARRPTGRPETQGRGGCGRPRPGLQVVAARVGDEVTQLGRGPFDAAVTLPAQQADATCPGVQVEQHAVAERHHAAVREPRAMNWHCE